MPRGEEESKYATFWQLKVLEVVARSPTWPEAEAELGLNKYQIDRLVRRLAKKLGIERGLLVELEGRPHVPDEFSGLVEEAGRVVFGYQSMEEKASQSRRVFLIRIDGYWSHVERFWGRVIGDFEAANPGVRIDLVPAFGKRRDAAGVGLARELSDRRADLVLAPKDPALAHVPASEDDAGRAHGVAVLGASSPDSEDAPRALRYLPAYRWALGVAIRPGHPLHDSAIDGTIDLSTLAEASREFPLVIAPPGHASRRMLERYESASRKFFIGATSPEPAALVALGQTSKRVPVIPSDSQVEWSEGWPLLVNMPLGDASASRPLGGAYAVYWRERDQPAALVPILRQFAAMVAVAASSCEPPSITEWPEVAE